jgi:23S rRNA (pseudouridine1915-N3)-methyltransferase
LKLLVVAVGHRMPAWVDAGFEEYARRMPREAQVKLIEIKPEPRSESDARGASRVMEAEGKRIGAALPKDALKIVLDEHGRTCTTLELAERMGAWLMGGRDVAFVIGGADGLSPAIKSVADFTWSLTPLTLPHGLARVLVSEQLYRAHSVLRNHPYHRESTPRQ